MHAAPPAASIGLTTPRGPAGAAVRAPSAALSASKQERLEALRNERLRIMQMQSSILSRPRTAMGTTPGRSIATPPPLMFRNTPMKEMGNENVNSTAAFEEISRLKDEIRQLKINEELARERMQELESAVARAQEEKNRIQRELKANERPSVNADEVAKLKQQLTREKDRVFVLCTEKQKLEEEVHDLKIERFSAEKTLAEIEVLKARLEDAGDWDNVKASLEAEVETLRRDNDTFKRDLKNEKSQRLVLLARIEELEKQVRDQKRIIDSTPVSEGVTGFKRISVVSSIPPADDHMDDTRAEFFAPENEPPKISLPGIIPAASRHSQDELSSTSPRLAAQPITPPPMSNKSSARHDQHWYPEQPAAPSFYDDVEKRGSAKKDYIDEKAPTDVGDLFGGGSVSAEVGSTEAQAGDIGDLFGNSPPKQKDTWGAASSTDDWMSSSQPQQSTDQWGASTPYQETPPDNQWGAQQSWNQQPQKQPSPKSQPWSQTQPPVQQWNHVPQAVQVQQPTHQWNQPVQQPQPAAQQQWNQQWQAAPQQVQQPSWNQPQPAQQQTWNQPAPASQPHPLVRPGGIPARSPASSSPSATPGLAAHQPMPAHAPMHPAFGGHRSPAGRPGTASPQVYPQQQVPQQYNPQHQTYVAPQFQQPSPAEQPFRAPQQSYPPQQQQPASNRFPQGPFRY